MLVKGDKPIEGPFSGQFGNWYLTERDKNEVSLYRYSLITCSISLCVLLGLSMLSKEPIWYLPDICFWISTVSLGVALRYIHIYAKPLKLSLQVFYSVGLLGSILLQFISLSHSVSQEIIDHPMSLLASGWLLVAMTGLYFKEYFCYRRVEAVLLTLLVPFLSLGHFLRVLPQPAEVVLSTLFCLNFIYFAWKKLDTPVIQDLGDKSVFEYLEKKRYQQ
eukprot:jgi/Galph1/1528/GphlegSOOS_G199.1